MINWFEPTANADQFRGMLGGLHFFFAHIYWVALFGLILWGIMRLGLRAGRANRNDAAADRFVEDESAGVYLR
jgi:hypothetical protein